MVSYRQLSSGQVVLHERETSSSGRPKATHGVQEDADYFYIYTKTGGMSRNPKTDMDKYKDFLWNEVRYVNKSRVGGDRYGNLREVTYNIEDVIQRITPATDYEIAMGYGMFNPAEVQKNYYHSHGTTQGFPRAGTAWKLKAEEISREHFRKLQEAEDKARKLAELAEQQRLNKLRETARPNPKEVEKVEPVEVEPIKEVAKYSPLMIAGVIAVVVIILWRRA